MKASIFLFVIILSYFGYQKQKVKNVIDVLSPTSSKTYSVSDIAVNIEFIRLQTTGESLIDRVRKVVINSQNIYISNFNEVFCFDTKGTFLYKLNRKGRGPEEYSNLFDYDINLNNDILIILSYNSILIFKNSIDGFVYSKQLNFTPQPSHIDFTGNNNDILLTYGNTMGNYPYQNIVINLKGDTLTTRPNYFKFFQSGPFHAFINEILIYKTNNTLKFKELSDDTIFRLDQKNRSKPYFVLNSRGKCITPEARANGNDFNEHSVDYLLFDKILETDRYLFYSYRFDKINYNYIYDKALDIKSEIDSKSYLLDDISGGANFKPLFSNDSCFYSYIDAYLLIKYIQGDTFKKAIVKNPIKKKELENLAETLDETDNPVLLMIKLKK